MTSIELTENYPTRFQQESLDLIHSLLPLTYSGFYLVDPDMRHRGVVLRNLDPEIEREYAENYRELDPLKPSLFADADVRVACIDDQLPETELLASEYYLKFMQPAGHRHVADMFFRQGDDIIAVLTMLRDEELGPYKEDELQLVRRLQPFLEYALNTVYMPRRYRQREVVQQRYRLTDRELDVLEYIVAGASNKIIARELNLSLATIKTHIQHIFQKVEVPSRTALSAQILGELGS